MLMKNRLLILLVLAVFVSGCRTTKPVNSAGETVQDVQKSVGTVASVMTGRKMSDEDVKKLERQMQNDPEARRAMESVTQSMGSQAVIKYCPIDGERYAGSMETCPIHNVKLEIVQP